MRVILCKYSFALLIKILRSNSSLIQFFYPNLNTVSGKQHEKSSGSGLPSHFSSVTQPFLVWAEEEDSFPPSSSYPKKSLRPSLPRGIPRTKILLNTHATASFHGVFTSKTHLVGHFSSPSHYEREAHLERPSRQKKGGEEEQDWRVRALSSSHTQLRRSVHMVYSAQFEENQFQMDYRLGGPFSRTSKKLRTTKPSSGKSAKPQLQERVFERMPDIKRRKIGSMCRTQQFRAEISLSHRSRYAVGNNAYFSHCLLYC